VAVNENGKFDDSIARLEAKVARIQAADQAGAEFRSALNDAQHAAGELMTRLQQVGAASEAVANEAAPAAAEPMEVADVAIGKPAKAEKPVKPRPAEPLPVEPAPAETTPVATPGPVDANPPQPEPADGGPRVTVTAPTPSAGQATAAASPSSSGASAADAEAAVARLTEQLAKLSERFAELVQKYQPAQAQLSRLHDLTQNFSSLIESVIGRSQSKWGPSGGSALPSAASMRIAVQVTQAIKRTLTSLGDRPTVGGADSLGGIAKTFARLSARLDETLERVATSRTTRWQTRLIQAYNAWSAGAVLKMLA
jgi:DNA repair exonuclease SbcCD ATPase subunit